MISEQEYCEIERRFEADRPYLDGKSPAPQFPEETGVSHEEILEGIRGLLLERAGEGHWSLKSRIVEYVIDHSRVDVSPHDWFIGFAERNQKSFWGVVGRQWQRETVEALPPELRKEYDGLTQSHLCQFIVDYAHAVPDWSSVLRLGFRGMRERCEEYRRRRRELGLAGEGEETYFDSLARVMNASLRLVKRLLTLAEGISGQGGRSARVAECLSHLYEGAPVTFLDALQQIWLFHLVCESVDCIQTRTLGNLDQTLYSYWKHDLEQGTFTEAELREILRYFFYQQALLHYQWGHPFYMGGTLEDGRTAINPLSYAMIEEYSRMGIYDPKIQIKVDENTPHDFLYLVMDMIRHGRNSIVFVGEPCIRRAMTRNGYTLEEARNADIKGCYEYSAKGAIETNDIKFNAAALPGIVLGNGIDPTTGFDTGIRTGTPDELKTFEQFLEATRVQMETLGLRMVAVGNHVEAHLDQINPGLFFTAASEHALQHGVDAYAHGVYNVSNFWIQFPANLADGLAAIQHFVYDTGRVTLEQFRDALAKNWEGYEPLRTAIQALPIHWGNDCDEIDHPFIQLLESFSQRICQCDNLRGGRYTVALHGSYAFVKWQENVGATADGRRRGEELSKNISPVSGRNWAGVTALIKSALKLDTSLFAADFPVDLMLHPSAVEGTRGPDDMISLVKTYVQHYGHAIQFNIFDAKVLRAAQEHPEQYRDLQVRVCGWNALWNSLTRQEQDNYIMQAEAHS